MSIMVTELYEALKAANAPEDKALAAATALAQHETQFSGLRQDMTEIKGELKLHRWMLGVVVAMQIATLWRVFI